MANIKVVKQYIKNLSIKVPNSPQVFINNQNKPDIEIAIDLDAKKISDFAYEVILQIKINANGGRLFECSTNYAGIFTLKNNDENFEEKLLVDCPNLLFPFCRNIISNLTSDAGFAPLMLDPIDFESLYLKRKESIIVN